MLVITLSYAQDSNLANELKMMLIINKIKTLLNSITIDEGIIIMIFYSVYEVINIQSVGAEHLKC